MVSIFIPEQVPATKERTMLPSDLPTVVRWHLENFPHSFYAQLGDRFMASYYMGYLDSPYAFARVAVDPSGQLMGYLVGTVNDSAHRRHTSRKHGLQQTLLGATCLALRPRLWWPFLQVRALWYARRAVFGLRRQLRKSVPGRTFGELAYVSTDVRVRGTGVGSQLTESYLTAATQAGASWAFLVTPAAQHQARQFYEARGWTPDGDRVTRDGAPLCAYRFQLTTTHTS